MSLDIVLIGALFLLLALIGFFAKKQKPAYTFFVLFLAVGGFLIMVCGVMD